MGGSRSIAIAIATLFAGLLVGVALGRGWPVGGPTAESDPHAHSPSDADAASAAARAGGEVGDDWIASARRTTMAKIRAYILPLNNPDTVPAAEAGHMLPSDIVVGVVRGEHARAYPWWIVANYHVVNDTLPGDDPVVVTLCERCSGAAAFRPLVDELPDRPLIFQINGLGQGTFEIADVQTHTTWHPFTGRSVEGRLAGRKLERIPVALEHWQSWRERHPDTDVVFASDRLRLREHGAHGGTAGHPNRIMVIDEPKELNLVDDRLPPNEMVLALLGRDRSSGVAVPLRELRRKGLVQLDVDGVPVVAFALGEYRAGAFDRRLADEVLSFERESQAPFRMRDGGGRLWDERGRAVSGPGEGAQLEPADGYVTEWYEWVTYVPGSLIQSDSPAIRRPREAVPAEAEEALKRGLALLAGAQAEAAAESFRRAVQLDPQLVLAHHNLGNALTQMGYLEEATIAYRRALELQPDFAETHVTLARTLERMGSPQQAFEHYRRAIEIDPDYADPYVELGRMASEQGDPQGAVTLLERALEIEPVNGWAQLRLARALLELGDRARALEHYQQVLRIDPGHEESLARVAALSAPGGTQAARPAGD